MFPVTMLQSPLNSLLFSGYATSRSVRTFSDSDRSPQRLFTDAAPWRFVACLRRRPAGAPSVKHQWDHCKTAKFLMKVLRRRCTDRR